MESEENLRRTSRTEVKVRSDRGAFDRSAAYSILDQGLVCHVSFLWHGTPMIIPMTYARVGDALYLHGSTKSRLMKHVASGAEVSVAVTHVDGLVLARSALHHSMN